MVEMGIFNALAVLKATSLILEAQFFCTSEIYYLVSHSYECLKEFGLCFLIYISMKQEAMAG